MSLSRYDAPNGSYTQAIPPGTTALRNFIKKKFGITRTEVIRNKSRCQSKGSEHCECGAIDAFTRDTKLGRSIFDWLVKHADAIGIQSVIWQHRQIGFGNPKERHRKAADHMDHVHTGLTRAARRNLTLAKLEAIDKPKEEDVPITLYRIGTDKRVWAALGGVRSHVPNRKTLEAQGLKYSDIKNVKADHPLAKLPVVTGAKA